MIDGNTAQQDIEKGLTLAITAWNSLVFGVVQNDPLHFEKLRNSILESDNPQGWMMETSMSELKPEK